MVKGVPLPDEFTPEIYEKVKKLIDTAAQTLERIRRAPVGVLGRLEAEAPGKQFPWRAMPTPSESKGTVRPLPVAPPQLQW